ncbi:TVP38/TMEM64 family protein [Hymenobacter sediminicola]|uniref:TVP38/TMEM64 family membrane protein n=1 Tax=Hymenobacter sediminicola TaxID=2761579 RepID=A0A7G7W9P6_9BACT|nr:VTT domain-containing protein [Hymenobacter sediminicola]QNH63089.1 TVP38/TMEM64 family protein [Hymenobacter sediminicola]
MTFLRELFHKNASTLLSMILLAGLPFVGSSSLGFLLYNNQDLLQDPTLLQGVLYFLVIGLAMAFSLMHTTLAVLITGFYFGWPGFPGMLVAYTLAALIGYQIASSLDHGKMLTFLRHFPKADAVMREMKADSWQLVFLLRISPVTPFALMTFILAVMEVNRRHFLLASVVGMLPRSLFFYWLGTKAQDIVLLLRDPGTGTVGKILVIVLVIVSFFGLYYLFSRAMQRALSKGIPKA